MKRLITFFLFIICSLVCGAQGSTKEAPQSNKDIDKMFNEALKRGPDSNGAYCIINSQNKVYRANAVAEYLSDRGYLTGVSSEKYYSRFGDSIKILDKIPFFKPSDASKYEFSILGNESGIKYDQLKNTGTFFYPDVIIEKGFITTVKVPKTFTEINDVLWSGDVVNGYLSGKGFGLAQFNGDWGFFEAEFIAGGFPITNIDIRTYDSSKNKITTVNKYDTQYAKVQSVIRSAAPKASADLRKPMMEFFKNIGYAEDAREIKNEYSKTLSLNYGGYDEFKKNKSLLENFIYIYDSLHYDPDGMLPKAKEMLEVYQILDALNISSTKSYRFMSLAGLIGGYDDFDEKGAEEDIDAIWDAQILVKNKLNSNSDFKRFYTNADSLLDEKEKKVSANISSEVDDYNAYVRRHNQEVANRSYSSSGSSYSSSSSSKESCRVHLVTKDGKDYANEEFCAGHKGFLGPTWVETFKTDSNGYAIISWDEDESSPDYITNTIGQEFSLFHIEFDVDDLDMKDGGSYTICLDCR